MLVLDCFFRMYICYLINYYYLCSLCSFDRIATTVAQSLNCSHIAEPLDHTNLHSFQLFRIVAGPCRFETNSRICKQHYWLAAHATEGSDVPVSSNRWIGVRCRRKRIHRLPLVLASHGRNHCRARPQQLTSWCEDLRATNIRSSKPLSKEQPRTRKKVVVLPRYYFF